MPEVFVSYKSDDRERASIVARGLAAEGFTVWWDPELRAGETYDEVIERNLRTAAAVVVLWSPRSVSSRWVRAEATVGDRRGALVPAMIEPCERPVAFELTQTADLTGWDGRPDSAAWMTFVQAVRNTVQQNRGAAPGTADPIEAVFWQSVEDSADPADFEAYLRRFPNGTFSTLARNRLRPATRPRGRAVALAGGTVAVGLAAVGATAYLGAEPSPVTAGLDPASIDGGWSWDCANDSASIAVRYLAEDRQLVFRDAAQGELVHTIDSEQPERGVLRTRVLRSTDPGKLGTPIGSRSRPGSSWSTKWDPTPTAGRGAGHRDRPGARIAAPAGQLRPGSPSW